MIPAKVVPTTPQNSNDRLYKSSRESAYFLSRVVGEDALYGYPCSSALILDVVDSLCGCIAFRHCSSMIATVSFDHSDFFKPIFHGDLICAQGHLVYVGTSSMTIKVDVKRYDLSTKKYQLVQMHWVTMVALIETGVINKSIPGLTTYSEKSDWSEYIQKKKDMYRAYLEKNEQFDQTKVKVPNASGKRRLLMKETKLVIKHVFFSRDLNNQSTIFGGAILLLAEKMATQCARMFTSNPWVALKQINYMLFRKPIFLNTYVTLTSTVVYVENKILEVEVEINLEKANGEIINSSHKGYFTFINQNKQGEEIEISTELAFENGDQEACRKYFEAKNRRTLYEWINEPTPDEFWHLSE